ncbi:MAG: hypothetical protein ACRDJF_05330 [Actinomycetota bacterium]
MTLTGPSRRPAGRRPPPSTPAGPGHPAWTGVVLYAGAAMVGYVVAPSLSLAVFVALPIFYGITSVGVAELERQERRVRGGAGSGR